jgi:hypothetical protein
LRFDRVSIDRLCGFDLGRHHNCPGCTGSSEVRRSAAALEVIFALQQRSALRDKRTSAVVAAMWRRRSKASGPMRKATTRP